MLKANFKPQAEVPKDEQPLDQKAEYRKKALENIAGSMVFVEREMIYWDGEK